MREVKANKTKQDKCIMGGVGLKIKAVILLFLIFIESLKNIE